MHRKIVVGLAVLLFVVSTLTVYAQNNAIQFEAFDFGCEGGNIVISLEPLIAGTSLVVVDVLNEKQFLVHATFFPDMFPNGTWEVPGRGHVVPNGFVVHHQGVGTGDLEGGRMKFKVTPVDVTPPPGCHLVGPAVLLDGVINFPPGQGR